MVEAETSAIGGGFGAASAIGGDFGAISVSPGGAAPAAVGIPRRWHYLASNGSESCIASASRWAVR